jgi:hypothetical protein
MYVSWCEILNPSFITDIAVMQIGACVGFGSAKQFEISLKPNTSKYNTICYYLRTGTEICNSCGVYKRTY